MKLPDRIGRIVYRQASRALQTVLSAHSSKTGGSSIKTLVLEPSIVAKKATYALTCGTLRYLSILKEIVASTDILNGKIKIQETLAYVLCYELLVGLGDIASGGAAESLILSRKSALKSALARMMVKRRVTTKEELLPEATRYTGKTMLRYVRVNTLKLSVPEALHQLSHFQVSVDELVPYLLVLPAGTELHDHPLVLNGSLVLQGKSSCLPAHALRPHPSWKVVDACAAPGNKSSQLAAMLDGGKQGGQVLACELDAVRVRQLRQRVRQMGANNVDVKHVDFLSVDPLSPEYCDVKAVLLDPSCSGSGTANQRLDHLMPSTANESEELKGRLEQLSKFQKTALLHALSFPAVERVVYSTCSIYEEENESVVQAVLPFATQNGFVLEQVFPQWPHRGLPVFEQAKQLLRMDADRDGTDGFFVALFSRVPSAQKLDSPAEQDKVLNLKKRKGGAELVSSEHVDISAEHINPASEAGCLGRSREGLLRRRKLKRERKKAAKKAKHHIEE